jgi:hypothetical protein
MSRYLHVCFRCEYNLDTRHTPSRNEHALRYFSTNIARCSCLRIYLSLRILSTFPFGILALNDIHSMLPTQFPHTLLSSHSCLMLYTASYSNPSITNPASIRLPNFCSNFPIFKTYSNAQPRRPVSYPFPTFPQHSAQTLHLSLSAQPSDKNSTSALTVIFRGCVDGKKDHICLANMSAAINREA